MSQEGPSFNRFVYESGHYFGAIGPVLIGLGVNLEVASTSSQKVVFAALVFAYGVWWTGTPLWSFVVSRD